MASTTDAIVEFLANEVAVDAEEIIPALMAATVVFALQTADPRQALDEAVNLLDEDSDVTSAPGLTH